MKPAYQTRDEWQLITLYSILFLFFFQLIAIFVEAIYSFGLMGTSIPKEIVSVFFFFSPLILLILGKRISGVGMLLLGELALLSRVVTPLLEPRSKMLISGLGVGCFLVLFPILLWYLGWQKRLSSAYHLGFGLIVGVALSALFRAWGSGSDLSTHGWFQVIGWALAIVAAVFLWRMFPIVKSGEIKKNANPSLGFMRLVGLCLGIMGVFVLLYFVFTSPNVIVRWVEGNYPAILASLAAGMILFSAIFSLKPDWLAAPKPVVLLIWNLLFIIALTFTILAYQIGFPPTPDAYPLYEPAKPFWADFALYSMLLLSPIILLDFILYAREVIYANPRPRQLGGGFLVASFFLLVMVLSHVFTTVYDYIPLIGPLFRDKFWLVHLVAGVVAGSPILLITSGNQKRILPRPVFVMVVTGVYLAAVLGVLLTAPKPQTSAQAGNTLRVMTYNIQQGYNESGEKNFDGQLKLIMSQNPDILGLQESDTNRIAGGNSDVVRYFADRLNMYSYYGPKTVTGTFGIALLSRYPIENPRTFFMYSEGEQTATIIANIRVGDKLFNLFVTHLGNSGPIVQQEALLKEVDGLENVIAMGDFNFRPNSEQYRLTTATLDDAWMLKWSTGIDDQGYNPTDRIDHVFVSPGTDIQEARYLTRPESDHPALVVEIAW